MNYYEILGVSRQSSHAEISKAFRVLAKEYHPDINKNPDAKAKFIVIYEAYSILKDEQKRSIYDKITFEKNEEATNSTTYSGWQEKAKEEGEYYSETKYNDFYEKVLKNIKIVAKTTKVIIGFFAAMIVCGLLSKFIISPILNAQIQNAIENSVQNINVDNSYSENNNTISDENTVLEETVLPLPIPLPFEDWKRIYIDGIGTIDIPPTMEVQSGIYKEIIDPLKPELVKSMGIKSNPNYDIIIQQKGLNDLESTGFQKYARVMINTDIGNIGDFDTLYFNINEYTATDVKEVNDLFQSSVKSSMAGTGLKIINWFPLRLENVNGMSCIHISYTRQLNNNPMVFVNIYKFQNVDRMYTLTLSYRQSEEEYWSNDYEIILNSFRIEDIK
jgi:curved DNA-binding protein CbpA